MGTVKDLIDFTSLPADTEMGEGTFWFKEFPDKDGILGGTFSVRDWGIMPSEDSPDLIPEKGKVLCLIGALVFEHLENQGIPTHYLGVFNHDDKTVTVDQLREPTNKMRIYVSRVIKPRFDPSLPDRYDYSVFQNGRGIIDNYVTPIEWIYRNSLPHGSSLRRKIIEAHEKGDTGYVDKQLRKLGLTEVPLGKETIFLPKPYNEFTTKYEQDDRDLGNDEEDFRAFEISGMTRDRFESAKYIRDRTDQAITEFYKKVSEVNGIEVNHLDGKLEIIQFGYPMIGDVAGTLDEIRASVDGLQISKEPVRQWYDIYAKEWSSEVRQAKEEARKRGLPEWTSLVKVPTPRLDSEYRILIGEMYKAFGNLVTYAVLKEKFFDARPVTKVLADVHSYLQG